MDRDSAIAKIKKCLALGRSSNPHEAAAAMRQAQKLMEQHGVDYALLELSDVAEAAVPVRSAALPAWEVTLAKAVADAFGCEMIVMRGHRLAFESQHRRSKYVFIGTGPSAQVAAYAHDVLAGQCAKARLAHIAKQPKQCKQITKTARGDAFAKAWVYGATGVLERFASGACNQQVLDAYKAIHWPDLKALKPTNREVGRNVRDDSWREGSKAGSNADLKRAVGGGRQQELLS